MRKVWYKVGYKFKEHWHYIRVEESELTQVILELLAYSPKYQSPIRRKSNDKEGTERNRNTGKKSRRKA